MKTRLLILIAFSFLSSLTFAEKKKGITAFKTAEKKAFAIYAEQPFTIYCHCPIYEGSDQKHYVNIESCGYAAHNPNYAKQLQWEHVVDANSFGQSFDEWREGSPKCIDRKKGPYKGRLCAEKNPEFAHMEGDLYNLWPESAELNDLKSNFSFSQIGPVGPQYEFGACKARIFERKFEPMDIAKGIVARTYMYMKQMYPKHVEISDKSQKLFEAWDKIYPVSAWECHRARIIQSIQGNEDTVVIARCQLAHL